MAAQRQKVVDDLNKALRYDRAKSAKEKAKVRYIHSYIRTYIYRHR